MLSHRAKHLRTISHTGKQYFGQWSLVWICTHRNLFCGVSSEKNIFLSTVKLFNSLNILLPEASSSSACVISEPSVVQRTSRLSYFRGVLIQIVFSFESCFIQRQSSEPMITWNKYMYIEYMYFVWVRFYQNNSLTQCTRNILYGANSFRARGYLWRFGAICKSVSF